MRTIWLAEDDADDRELFELALKSISQDITLVSAENGHDLLQLLEKTTSPKPDIIFIDMNMPVKNGAETLACLKESIRFHRFHVVIFSTSDNLALIDDMYEKGAGHYVVKPDSFPKLKKVLYNVLSQSLTWKSPVTRDKFVLTE